MFREGINKNGKEFLQDKFFSTTKYDNIIDEDDLKFIQNNKNTDKTDDFER